MKVIKINKKLLLNIAVLIVLILARNILAEIITSFFTNLIILFVILKIVSKLFKLNVKKVKNRKIRISYKNLGNGLAWLSIGLIILLVFYTGLFNINGKLFADKFFNKEISLQEKVNDDSNSLVPIPTPIPLTPVNYGDDLMIERINEVRAKNGIAPVVEDERLNRSAEDKACDMRNKGYFAHKDPDGQEAWHYFLAEKYFYIYAGENLSNFSNDLDSVMKMFVESPEHFKNIIDSHYVDVGIGVCGQYVVQHFGN